MGCASSKQSRCEHCQAPYSSSSLSRSYSVPVHHPASGKGDSYHVVALTSSTLGSLPSDSILNDNFNNRKAEKQTTIPTTTTTANNNRNVNDSQSKEFLTKVLQAKNWSDMIEEKIPKVIPRTPIRTPPGEPEMINTWELMEGLDDCSPLRLSNRHDRSFSFHAVSNTSLLIQSKLHENGIDSPTIGHPKPKLLENVTEPPKLLENGTESPKPQWLQMADDDSESPKPLENGTDSAKPQWLQMGDKDPESPKPLENGTESPKPEWLQMADNDSESPKPLENGTESPKPEWLQMADDDSISSLNSLISDFDPEIVSQFRKALEELSPVATAHVKSPEREQIPFSRENLFLSKDFIESNKVTDIIMPTKCPPCGEDKVVIYFTSLRGVRKTYEDCCHVRVIFKGFGVRIDERDVSMHYGFREELKELLGEIGCSGGLPRVFVNGGYIGGAEEIRELNEDGKLQKLVEGCAVVEEGNGLGACELCGDVRFVPCESCSGSCKIYCEDCDEWEGEGVGEFQRCPECNENGLVRCPVCCY